MPPQQHVPTPSEGVFSSATIGFSIPPDGVHPSTACSQDMYSLFPTFDSINRIVQTIQLDSRGVLSMALSRLLSQWRSRVRFQIMSDLHLEVGQQYTTFDITPHATCLILAGDVGQLKFVQVYLVLGNHEFFGTSREEGLRLADRLQQEPGLKNKLVLMNRKRVDIEEVTLLGCTLHSHIPPEAEEVVRSKVNDFRRIADWTVSDHTAEHARDVRWLIDEISSIRRAEQPAGLKRKIVVITHHAPTMKGTSRPFDERNPWSSAFATDLIGIEERSWLDDVQLCVFGHTHYSTELVCGQVRLVSNQRGYVLPNRNANESKTSKGPLTNMLKNLINGRWKEVTFDIGKVIEV
ncbi:hypothetical protein ACJ73_08483 [Blastomyces percursus]|uniref:Calcineurin-like phosphoesterase domain-containing protein n=1 Tax=Blastomyces percursus TaxID=1658174 RepID=A0A1J9PUW6_9EURO|nr:hypothetical protein ACJ73_08483 [Blastomyces percursus]